MDDSFERMKKALVEKTGEVELDVEVPPVSADPALASKLAGARDRRVSAGERVAHLYTPEWDAKYAPSGQRFAALSTGVSREQALELLNLGAKWIGPEHRRP